VHDLERLNIIRIIQFAPFDAFILQKSNLYRIYGHNPPTPRKIEAVEELKKGKDFHSVARKMNVTLATAEVYAIDSFAANAPLDETIFARHLEVDSNKSQGIRAAIERNTDGKLRTIKDELKDLFTYNQIRFVIACLIRDIEI